MSSETTSELDPTTLAAVRNALAAAQMGRLADACAMAERALANGGDATTLNAMLGMLRGRAGDTAGALRHLELAHRARPGDLRIAGNFASALANAGEFKQAMTVASAERAQADLQIARVRGYAAQMLEQPAAAIEAYEHVVATVPGDWESWNNLGNARLALDDVERGIAALRRSAELNPEAAPTRFNLARAYRKAGDFAEAERQLRSMADHFADDVMSLMELHDLLKSLGRPDEELLETVQMALLREPDDLKLRLAAARQLTLLLKLGEAEGEYRRALAKDPANVDAYIGLATVYDLDRTKDLDQLAAEAAQVAIAPGALNLVQAFAHRRAKRFADGLAAVLDVPEDLEPTRRAELLGQFHEGLKQYDEAFAAYTKMNELQASNPSRPLHRAETLRNRLRDNLEQATPEWVQSWAAEPKPAPMPPPVFLLGFPRSGTTLLDTMLMGHADVEVMEERPVINRVEREIGGIQAIPAMDDGQVEKAQRRYFGIASEFADVDRGALLVDKSPLLINRLSLIYRLFPNAKIILALRHPLDSVLSCFVTNFRPNSSMSNFMKLETAAEFYDLTFQIWENARSVFPLNVHTVVYEKLIGDPKAELRRLSEFLDLPWREEMLDHRKTAAERGLITTASYAQVPEPIYRRSVGRWQNYRKHLEPIIPVLAPWVEKFGYKL